MIIFWRGAGGLVLIFGIASALITNIATSLLFKETNYFANHPWAQAASLWITGLASWFLGRFLNSRPPKMVTNRNGQPEMVKPNHHLMFIKMEYWGPIFFVIGTCVLIAGALKN